MIIDAHVHIDFNGWKLDDVLRYMDHQKIEKAWLLSWEELPPAIPFEYQHVSVEAIVKAWHRYPDRFVPMYAPDPRRRDAVQRLRYWYERGIRGCGELKVALPWESDKLSPLLECVNELGMPLTFHMEGGRTIQKPQTGSRGEYMLIRMLQSGRLGRIPRKTAEAACAMIPSLRKKKASMAHEFPGYLNSFEQLERCLRKYPRIKFIGHGPMFWKGMTTNETMPDHHSEDNSYFMGVAYKLLERYRNLYADLSGQCYWVISKHPLLSKKMITRFANKMLFGTDNFKIGLRKLLQAMALDTQSADRVFFRNAIEILNEKSG